MSVAYQTEVVTHATPTPRFRHRRIDSYARLGRIRVKGWLNGLDAGIIADLGHIQTEQGISGSVGEIGVHHGKLFILLYLLTHRDETAFCIDVFEMQHLNIDRSGRGSPTAFRDNLARVVGASPQIHLIKSSSEAVTPAQITAPCGKVRLFSIDGGHTAYLTQNDLALAAASLCDGGVVIVDDYFQPAWPGVSEGVVRHFRDHPDQLVPFAISFNKVFFCQPRYAALYRARLKQRRPRQFNKESEFLGRPVTIYRKQSLRVRLRSTPVWRAIRYTQAGRTIKAMVGIFVNS